MAATAAAAAVPAIRMASRVQIATSFFPQYPSSSSSRRRGGHAAGPPPALTVEVRVVIRRHFPVVTGPCGGTRTAVVQKVAEDIALRRRPSRKLRAPERVARAVAQDVLPLVCSPLDRGAVAAASGEICAHVSAACADPRVARSGVRVLVLVDTFQYPAVVFRRALLAPPPCKPMWGGGAVNKIARTDNGPCMDLESELPAAKWPRKPTAGVIGDRRLKQVEEPFVDHHRLEGWLPW